MCIRDRVTDLEAQYVIIENTEEAKATYHTYQALKQTIESALDNIDVDLSTIVSKIEEIVADYVNHLNKLIEAGYVDFSDELAKIDDALKKLVAYRNAVDTTSSLQSSTESLALGGVVSPGYAYTVTVTVEAAE